MRTSQKKIKTIFRNWWQQIHDKVKSKCSFCFLVSKYFQSVTIVMQATGAINNKLHIQSGHNFTLI